MSKRDVLQQASFGQRVAELESDALTEYFVETEQWQRLLAGEVDVVYGPKGAGKSALYSLLSAKREELFDRGILVVPAENPSGTTAFSDVATDPPTSEAEFVGVWKVYFLSLLASVLEEYGVKTADAEQVYEALREAGLLTEDRSGLRALLQGVRQYVRRVVAAEAVEGGIVIDPSTGLPIGITGKIILGEPNAEQRDAGLVSVDSLLASADRALAELDFAVWLTLDRLDVAFEQHEELEQNALRALFRAYLDIQSLRQIGVKIFSPYGHLAQDYGVRISRSEPYREESDDHMGAPVACELILAARIE